MKLYSLFLLNPLLMSFHLFFNKIFFTVLITYSITFFSGMLLIKTNDHFCKLNCISITTIEFLYTKFSYSINFNSSLSKQWQFERKKDNSKGWDGKEKLKIEKFEIVEGIVKCFLQHCSYRSTCRISSIFSVIWNNPDILIPSAVNKDLCLVKK